MLRIAYLSSMEQAGPGGRCHVVRLVAEAGGEATEASVRHANQHESRRPTIKRVWPIDLSGLALNWNGAGQIAAKCMAALAGPKVPSFP